MQSISQPHVNYLYKAAVVWSLLLAETDTVQLHLRAWCNNHKGKLYNIQYGQTAFMCGLILPDFDISVHSRSCNFLFLGLILAPLLPPSIYWYPHGKMKYQEIERKKKREWDQKRKNDMNCHTQKSIRYYIVDSPSALQKSNPLLFWDRSLVI